MSAATVALDLITVRAGDANYFLTEQAPGIPLVIELCNGYLLTPVSGVFRNPFSAIRMLRESTSVAIQNAFRAEALLNEPSLDCKRITEIGAASIAK